MKTIAEIRRQIADLHKQFPDKYHNHEQYLELVEQGRESEVRISPSHIHWLESLDDD
jgi:hypothetical protein